MISGRIITERLQNMAGNNNNLIPPKKGEVRNPKGRGKGVPNSKTRLKRLLELTEDMTNPITKEIEGFSVAEQMDLAQIVKARKGDTKAYNAVMDRLEGRPKQAIDMAVDGELNIALVEFVDDGENQSKNT